MLLFADDTNMYRFFCSVFVCIIMYSGNDSIRMCLLSIARKSNDDET